MDKMQFISPFLHKISVYTLHISTDIPKMFYQWLHHWNYKIIPQRFDSFDVWTIDLHLIIPILLYLIVYLLRVGKIPWRRERQPTPVFWLGKFHGLYSPWVAKSRTWLSDFHFTDSYSDVVSPESLSKASRFISCSSL